tara:strand:+ start:725 stop:7564 length:6840 start_codon:yes stop_codon:yes gene_type:complete
MPEIKKQFTGGKMNKDLDERLVPNGEYRDAMNVQVSTSEASDVGTVQNILGNKAVEGLNFLNDNSTCVGSISDEKDNALYWFVHEEVPSSFQFSPPLSASESPALINIKASNYILRHSEGQISVVFADVTHKRCVSPSNAFLTNILAGALLNITFPSHNFAPGDVITTIQIQGDVYTELTLPIISTTATSIVIDLAITVNNTGLALSDLAAIIASPFGAYTSVTTGALGFTGSQITGINIIDDILLWADGSTEPKKINIPRSIFGTDQNGLWRTRLVVNGQILGFIEESHITVIKKGPSHAPTLTQLTSSKGVVAILKVDSLQPVILSGLVDGDMLEFSVGSVDFEVGDTLLLTPSVGTTASGDEVRVVVTVVTPLSVSESKLTVEIITMPDAGGLYSGQILSVQYEEVGKNLFKLKFPRFALRYKYEDSEYSPVGPFSNVAFIPGSFDYHPTEAFNLGMNNELRSLTVEDYIAQDIPKDVTQVDILYKNDTAPSIYIVKSVYKNEAKDTVTGQNTWDINSYKVSTENIYAQLPENQLLRPWDNVPRAALAQDVVGNRVVYGNYQQNYDMLSGNGEVITPSFETFLTAYDGTNEEVVGRKSIKSIRTYDFGIVYIDEYGRETPVFADTNAAQTVPKLFSDKSTRFSLSIKDNHPDWADSYKVFIKETSNEYYNLALDRVYDAEDGNVWLSFPSVDRNKVDEETYLILKKSEGENAIAVKDDNRYKVVAIKNEAPEYIKTNWDVLSEPSILDIRGIVIYGLNPGSGFIPATAALAPYVGHSRFTINKRVWNDPFTLISPERMGLGDLEKLWDEKGEDEIYVFFTENETVIDTFTGVATTSPRKSQKYLVTDITLDTTVLSSGVYEISISKPISGEDEWITTVVVSDSVPGANTNSDRSHPHFYKKVVKNLPEFDGRFFVKIIEDAIIRDKLKTPIELRQNYIVENSLDAYYFQDTIPGGVTGNTSMVNPGANKSRDRSDWLELAKFGGSTKKSGWIIDGAAYAGAERVPVAGVHGILPLSDTNVYANGGYNSSLITQYANDNVLGWISDFTSFQIYYHDGSSNIYGAGAGLGGSLGIGWGSGYSKAIVFGQGIHQGSYVLEPDHENTGGFVSGTASTDKLYLSLSYVGPIGGGHTWGNEVNAGDGASDYAKLYQRNPYLSEMKKVLKRNQRFRIIGSAGIYKIKKVTERWLFNYRGGVANNWYYEEHGNNSLTYDHQVRDFKSRWNRRVNYLIEYELVDPAGDDLSNNVGLTNVSPVDFARIEFLNDYFEEGPNPISAYPAVFETEPKEDVGLDIYYEATNALPLKLTYSNQQNFASIGTLVEFTTDWGINGPPGDFYIKDWGSGVVDPNVLFLDRDLPQLTVLPFIIGQVTEPHLKFSRPDGSFVFANIVAGFGLYSNPTLTVLNTTVNVLTYEGVAIEILPNDIGLGWHNCWAFGNGVESNRIGDTYNKPYLTNGAKASTTLLEQYAKEHRKHGLIYSGIYNSNSNTNGLNQFIAAEKITKDVNPTYGSIQKLHARDSNLVVLCEDKILKVTANKDALYNADGNPQLIATNRVLGQTIPFVGEYGISKNPESFASESYRAYFTDKARGAVIRLSMDGITPISEAGMSDWFYDNLKLNDTIIGSYDDNNAEYNITLKHTVETTGGYECGPEDTIVVPKTISFKESVKGWVSFKSFVPENAISCNNEYYTFLNGKLYLHHDESVDRNTFYDDFAESKLSVVFNNMPGSVKSFRTLNYEGSQARVTQDLGDDQYFNLNASDGWFVDYTFTNKEEGSLNEFIEKEGKWFNYIKGISSTVDCTSDLAGFNVQGIGVYSCVNTPNSPDYVQGTGSCGIHVPRVDVMPYYNNVEIPTSPFHPVTGVNIGLAAQGIPDVNGRNVSYFQMKWFFENPSVNFNDVSFHHIQETEITGGCLVSSSKLGFDPNMNNYWQAYDVVYLQIDGTDYNGDINGNPIFPLGSNVALSTTANVISLLAFVPNSASTGLPIAGNNGEGNNYQAVFNWVNTHFPGVTNPSMTYNEYFTALQIYGVKQAVGNWIEPLFGTATTGTRGNICGCTDPNASNYDPLANSDDGSCIYPVVLGCTNPLATNYNPLANTDDGTCVLPVFGCMDKNASNHNPLATVDDGSCLYPPISIPGCTDPLATNYNSEATVDDGSCIYPPPPPPPPPPPRPPAGLGFMAVELIIDTDSSSRGVESPAALWVVPASGIGASSTFYSQYVGSQGSGNYTYSWNINGVISTGANSALLPSASAWSATIVDVMNGYTVSFSGTGVPSGTSILHAIS